MPSDRLLRILSRLAADESGESKRLCAVSAAVTHMSGAGLMLVVGDVPHGTVCTTDAVSALIEELQFTLGEGPCIDACRLNVPVIEPDLANPVAPRWAEFSRSAVGAGARAVFGFPVSVGDERVGALNLYRDRPGGLSPDQHADAVVLANVAASSLAAMQARASEDAVPAVLDDAKNLRFAVHQAAGMIAVQLGVSVDEAMVRLRSRAFRTARSVSDLAADVVARRLRFDDRDD